MSLINLKRLNTLIGAGIGGGGGVNPPLVFKGLWDADTNTPILASGVGTEGDFYIVSVAGSTNLDGITDWEVRDWAVFVNGVWNKIDNTEPVPEPAAFGEMYFQGNATETVIPAIDTPVQIGGTYVSGELQQFTQNAGVLTYTGNPTTLIVMATTTESYNAVNADTTMKIAKDGSALATSGQEIGLFGTTPQFNKNTVMKLVPVVNGSTISVFTENNGGGLSEGTENITHRDLHVMAFSIGAGGPAPQSSLLFSQTEDEVLVENTVAVTSIKGTGIGNMFIKANTLSLGDTYEFVMAGKIQTNGAAQTISFRLSDGVGSQNIFFNTGQIQLSSNAAFTDYIVRARGTVQLLGANTVARLHTVSEIPKIGSTVNEQVRINRQSIGFDTTIDINYDVYVQWGAASLNNKVTCDFIAFNKV